jgi:hypothetical protein
VLLGLYIPTYLNLWFLQAVNMIVR